MAKKTNKTSHVLNLISNRTGLPEEEIAPEASSKKRPASQNRDIAPQTVEDLLAEDIPAAPQGQYQKKEKFSESPMAEESWENPNFSEAYDEPYPHEEAYPPAPEDEMLSASSNPAGMNIPDSPKAFADAISAAQEALADTLPPEQPSSATLYDDTQRPAPFVSATEQEPTQNTQETYDNREPSVPLSADPMQSQTLRDTPPAPEASPSISAQSRQPLTPKKTFADLIPPTQKETENSAALAEIHSQANSAGQYYAQPTQTMQQPIEQPYHKTQGYQPAAQGQQVFYPNQGGGQSAAGYHQFSASQYPGQSLQYQQIPQQPITVQQPMQPQMIRQPMQAQMVGQPMQAQMPQQPMTAQQTAQSHTNAISQMIGHQSAAIPYPAPSAPLEQPPEITPYNGPKTAQPSLINALFGKPGSKKAAPVLMDEETPDPRLFQPFDVSGAILKNIEDYVDQSIEHTPAASAGTADSKKRPVSMEEKTIKPIERIPFKKGPFVDPVNSYTFLAKNIMEDLVINQMFTIMQKFDMCTCNKCVNDVLALSLNALPPKYVVSKQTSLYVKLAACEKQYDTDIVSAITQACVLVQKNPRHEPKD